MSFLNNVDKTIDGENIFTGDIFNCNQDFEVEGNAGAVNQFLHKNVINNALEWYTFSVNDNLTEGYCIDLSGNSISVDLHELTFSNTAVTVNDFIPIIKIDGDTHTETRHHISSITNLVTLVGSGPITVSGLTIAFSLDPLSELATSLSNDMFYTISNNIAYKVKLSTIADKIFGSLQSTAPISNVSGNFTFSINNLNTHSISNNDFELIVQANSPPHHSFYKVSITNLFQYSISNMTINTGVLLTDTFIYQNSAVSGIRRISYDDLFKHYPSKLGDRNYNNILPTDRLVIYDTTLNNAYNTSIEEIFTYNEFLPTQVFQCGTFEIAPVGSTNRFLCNTAGVSVFSSFKAIVSGTNPTFEVGSRYTKLQLTTHTDRPLFRFDNHDNIIDGLNSGGLNLYALNGGTNKLNFYDTYTGSGNILEVFGGSAGTTKGHIKLYTPTLTNSMLELSIVNTKPYLKIMNPNIADGVAHRDILSINGTNHTIEFHGKNDTGSHNQIFISGGNGTGGGYTEFCNIAHGSSILTIDESGLMGISENSANNSILFLFDTLPNNSSFDAKNNSDGRSMFKIENTVNKIKISETNTANNRLMVESDCDAKTTSFKDIGVGNRDLVKIDHETGTFTIYQYSTTYGNQLYRAFEYNATTKHLDICDGVGSTILKVDQTKVIGDIGLINIPNGALPSSDAGASSGDMFLQQDGTSTTHRLCVHY